MSVELPDRFMNRRDFLAAAAAFGISQLMPSAFAAARQPGANRLGRLLILIELNGGNDGLNTVIPFADPAYLALRPTIGIRRDQVLQLDERTGLHPSMQALMPIWRSGHIAIVQGIGYPGHTLSHYRSMEIWDTASNADQYLRDTWLDRASAVEAFPATSQVITDTAYPFRTAFPADPFGTSIRTAMELVARSQAGSVIRLKLNGFDTHANQPVQHARLLKALSEGLAAMQSALIELGRWNDTLVVTHAEFGRHPRENDSNGTDHGTAAPHFVMGGRVNGGMHGAAPDLTALDGNSNLRMSVDFRQIYATILRSWCGTDAGAILNGRFETLPLLRA